MRAAIPYVVIRFRGIAVSVKVTIVNIRNCSTMGEGESGNRGFQRLNAVRISPACTNAEDIPILRGVSCYRRGKFAGGRITLALSTLADKADDSDGCDLDVNKQVAKGSRFRRRRG